MIKDNIFKLKVVDNKFDNKDLVEHLKMLLEKAESGEMVSIIYVTEEVDGGWSHGCSEIQDIFQVIGYLEYTKTRYLLGQIDD